jgi:predicted amidohydrolase
MIDTLSIGIVQLDILWENIKGNQYKIEQIISNLKNLPQLILLPEVYSTGFTMSPNNLDRLELKEQINWQIELSKKYNVAIMGSVVSFHEQFYTNRMLYTTPKGATQEYDKRHLFHFEEKSGFYKAGTVRKCFHYDGLKLMPQICYDLRFPVWSRNNLDYQLLVYVANWPASRQLAWETLLPARAIENQCYVVGVNRVGKDKNGIAYSGGSAIYSPKGKALLKLTNKEQYAELSISIDALEDYQKRFPVLKDADLFTLKNPDKDCRD